MRLQVNLFGQNLRSGFACFPVPIICSQVIDLEGIYLTNTDL